ncbi:uncharacterized protein TNCT_415931 [Trichonephila clavata]|uniref:Uncharacterized protein n=1 Tax=Trichonephila clavata TaxID=2740835 RepID=A0A8X6GMW4_TRICU|nr:uncharacterized protein TNCT_415931 [Trichonephila clavata]
MLQHFSSCRKQSYCASIFNTMENTVFLNQMAESFLHKVFMPGSNDLVNIHTLKYRTLNDFMCKLDLTFQGLNQLINTHSPVDPEVAKVIQRWTQKYDGVESILAQDFVKNERLNKLIHTMVKSGQSNIISSLLAIDGLIGPKLNTGPHFDCKKYLQNLKYSLSGEPGRYDREEDDLVKRTHVCAIREVYKELENYQSDIDSKLMYSVYQVMSHILKESAGLELPIGPGIPIPDNVMEACSNIYWANTSWEYFNSLVEILKSKISTPKMKSLLPLLPAIAGLLPLIAAVTGLPLITAVTGLPLTTAVTGLLPLIPARLAGLFPLLPARLAGLFPLLPARLAGLDDLLLLAAILAERLVVLLGERLLERIWAAAGLGDLERFCAAAGLGERLLERFWAADRPAERLLERFWAADRPAERLLERFWQRSACRTTSGTILCSRSACRTISGTILCSSWTRRS